MLKEKVIRICDYIIEYGILAIVFFIPIIIDFAALSYNIVDLYKIVVFRVILALMLLAFAAKVFIIGRLSYRGGAKFFLFTLFLLLSFFLSSFFSVRPNQSFWGDFFRQQGFYIFFNYLLFFILLILNLKDFKQIKRIIATVIFSASLTAVYGLVQYFDLDPVSWTEKASSIGRLFSTLGQPNWFGHYLILVLPFGLYALIFMAKSFWARFFVGLSILIQLICLILTYSRAAWLGFLGSMAFLFLVWLIYKRYKRSTLGFIGLLLIGLIMIIGLNIVKPVDQKHLYDVNIINRLKSIVDFKGGSSKMRLYYLRASLQEIKQAGPLRLLLGFGPETLTGVFIKYYQPDWGVYEAINGSPDRAHNWFFDQILALGVFGLTATMAFYIYFIYKAVGFFSLRPKLGQEAWLLIFLFASLVAYCINNLFSFSLFTVLVYLYLILAIVWLMINHQAEEKIIDIRLTGLSKILIWVSLLAVSAVFIWTNNINQVKAEIYYMKAVKAMQSPDCDGVMDNMEKAINFSPNSSYYQENFLFLAANCFPLISNKIAQIELSNAVITRQESINDQAYSGMRLNLARFYTMLGFYINKSYYQRAAAIFNKLILDYPNLTPAYEDFGRQKMMQEDYPGVIDVYKRGLEILPPLDNPYLNDQHRAKIDSIAVRLDEGLGQAYFKIKNYDLALDYYKKGLGLDPYRATLYKNIADIYYVQGRLDEAVAWNKRGFTLNPADYNWPLALSLLYRDKKDLTRAREYLNQALKLAPDNQELKKYYEEINK